MPREDKPNVLFGCDDHRFHMFTADMRNGGRGRSSVLLKPRPHGHCSAHLRDPRLRQQELWVGYLIKMKRKINVNFLTTICRQTVFVKKSF